MALKLSHSTDATPNLRQVRRGCKSRGCPTSPRRNRALDTGSSADHDRWAFAFDREAHESRATAVSVCLFWENRHEPGRLEGRWGPRFLRWVVLVLAALCFAPAMAPAQGLEYVKSHYTKYEYRIPMRDGKRLFTAVYVPKDESQRYPILLDRTPYSVGPYGVDQSKSDLGPSSLFCKQGYIFAYQDVRGDGCRKGVCQYAAAPAGQADAGRGRREQRFVRHDRVAAEARVQPQRQRGMWGISYPGFYTAAGMIDAHPALKAASPQAPIVDWFVGDDWHHHGALMLPHVFNFMAVFAVPAPSRSSDRPSPSTTGPPTATSSSCAWARWPTPTPGTSRATWPSGTKSCITGPTTISGRPAISARTSRDPAGGDDRGRLVRRGEPFRALETYKHVEAHSPPPVNTLVMGPWVHAAGPAATASRSGQSPSAPRRPNSTARASSCPSSSFT